MNRIIIIGGMGTGKTTLANNLEEILNIQACHLDGINYFKDWVKRDKNERDEIILEKIKEEKWIIDGTYMSTLNERIQASDTVIFLNYSLIARLKGIFERYIKNKNQEKKEIPGCKEQMSLFLISSSLKYSKKVKKIKQILNRHQDKNILIFNNRGQLNKWFEKEFNKKISTT